ncbi:hypothetical protein F2Q70_00005240 [Brassica cretica]|uniref:BnaC09g33110D protein n=4 Tax=Brassica TaxID=3705 RepID=A0A078H5V8_BRANA|nr:hypothetical protein F2Q70_00005240 [Brassica cretica]KAH0859762.1 hypothetical protein HID58_088023 [Brassica napus]CAF1764771.1 unnamed protein product [Brassica napus]CDY32864.1 BnaC09g33110D [Brassica napus]VDD32344.1 unnamed protein product [Brassica oleracea]
MVKRLRLNDLPDELILKIFSMLPNFEESVATNLMSKQHEDPYKLVSDVTCEDDNEESLVTFMRFVYGSLLSDDDQILQRLHLKLVRNFSASEISPIFWVNRSVRKLRFDLSGGTLDLPSCLSTCTTLKSLILRDVRIDVVPVGFSLPSLKSLHLLSVDFSHRESIASLLRGCPDLEYLVLNQTSYDYWEFGEVRFCLLSLKSLHLLSARYYTGGSLTRLLQSCPVLEYLVVTQTTERFWNFWDIPPASCLSSIKSLHLTSVRVWNDESIATLLKGCAALEDLVIIRTEDDNVRIYNISVPTLKSLTINNTREKRLDDKENHGFWINAPALQTLNIKDTVSNFIMLEFMPEVTKANIQANCVRPENFIGSLTSIQHLSLCSRTSEVGKLCWPRNVQNVSSIFGYFRYILHLLTPYRSGSIFPYLEHLELCTCSPGWANLLSSILGDTPSLHSLKLKSHHSAPYNDPKNFWNEPAVVPKCLLTHLEIFEWRQYENTVQQRIVAAYILANATYLKIATFSTRSRGKYYRMVMKLRKLNRISKTCQLVFE